MDEARAAKLLTPAACRAARALLGWSIGDLVREARTSPNSVSRFERGEGVLRPSTALQIVQAFDAAGVEITNGDGTGARLRI
jgi:transcriptional regulator with XRE-family HTH domain